MRFFSDNYIINFKTEAVAEYLSPFLKLFL